MTNVKASKWHSKYRVSYNYNLPSQVNLNACLTNVTVSHCLTNVNLRLYNANTKYILVNYPIALPTKCYFPLLIIVFLPPKLSNNCGIKSFAT